jgi:CRP/FNR family transcriptional regulator, cyclic AMP receptor protein
MKTMRDILADQDFFQGFTDPQLDLIAGCATNARFDDDTYILREGDPADHFWLITHGRAALEVFVPGRGPLVLQTLGAGEVVGWSWLFPPHRWRYDGRAVDLVRAIAIDGRCLREKAEADHDLGYELMRRFAAVVIDLLTATRLQLVDSHAHAGTH